MSSAPRWLLPVALAALCLAVAAWGPARPASPAARPPPEALISAASTVTDGQAPLPTGPGRLAAAPLVAPLARPSRPPPGPTGSAGLANLDALNAKAVAKTQKQIAAAEAKRDKLLARQAKLLAKQADWEAALAAFEADLVQAPLDLAAAELALAEALALPAETPEQVQLRKQAIQAAQKALKLAKKTLKKAQKQVPRLTKRLAKLAVKLGKLDAKLAAVQATLDGLDSDLQVQQQPFHFSSLSATALGGQLVDGAHQPLAHATVLLVDPADPALEPQDPGGTAVHWRGFSQADGGFGGALRLPAGQELVDLVVSLPGYSGPYTHEGLRQAWGAYAPAARVTVAVDALDGLVLQLLETQP